MSDNLAEVTHTSWFSRLSGGITGIFVGLFLVIAACIALFWNEGRAVKTMRALEEGAGQVVSISADAINIENEGKLVHISGPVDVKSPPVDSIFKTMILPPDTIAIGREVEMYQWKQNSKTETAKKVGGGETKVTTYSYVKEWAAGRDDSSNFKQPEGHSNPEPLLKAEQAVSPAAKIGAFEFDGSDLAGLGQSERLVPSQQMAAELAASFDGTTRVAAIGDYIIVGENSGSPRVGDLRISFSAKQLSQASIVGQQKGDSIGSFTTSNGRKIRLSTGKIADATSMFDGAQSSNNTTTWLFRIGGLLAMLAGFRTMFSLIGIVGDLIPFIGNIFRLATGLASMALTSILGPIVIAIAWIAYRPLIGFVILAVGLALAAAFIALGKRKGSEVTPQTIET